MNDQGVTAVLLLSCPDQKGLVAAVSDFLYRNNGNIIHADQHTDQEEGVFLQRVEWELAGFAIARDEIADAFQPIADRFGMTWSLHFSDIVPRMAVFVSRLPHCLYDLLARWRMGEFRADVPLVVSNHAELRPIAENFGVAYREISSTPRTRDEVEGSVLQLLEEERIDVLVLARYMQVLSRALVDRLAGRAINIHHSFLPSFAGARPYQQAHARGVKLIGATAHYVTPQLDAGPIIEQDVGRVDHAMSVDEMVATGRDIEATVLARAIRFHLEHRVLINGGRTVVFR